MTDVAALVGFWLKAGGQAGALEIDANSAKWFCLPVLNDAGNLYSRLPRPDPLRIIGVVSKSHHD